MDYQLYNDEIKDQFPMKYSFFGLIILLFMFFGCSSNLLQPVVDVPVWWINANSENNISFGRGVGSSEREALVVALGDISLKVSSEIVSNSVTDSLGVEISNSSETHSQSSFRKVIINYQNIIQKKESKESFEIEINLQYINGDQSASYQQLKFHISDDKNIEPQKPFFKYNEENCSLVDIKNELKQFGFQIKTDYLDDKYFTLLIIDGNLLNQSEVGE
ncbi:MAG: hypothetical protein HOI55_06505 [Candidatus Marinimicrobia bacterium]|nr:hypothetical protein [Candidatus Neomarinimicrobiota bacterium]MBT5759291.1 hypothetical protein [Candidatus Neomarinimicrobiota bacterium]MBT7899568.1 hypothetical protein [Candidatus Neomarinimicrobiota bacterium]